MSYETRAGHSVCQNVNIRTSDRVRHHDGGVIVFNRDNTLRCDVTVCPFSADISIEIYSLQKTEAGISVKLLTTLYPRDWRAAKTTIHGIHNSNIDIACGLLFKGSGKERAKFLGY